MTLLTLEVRNYLLDRILAMMREASAEDGVPSVGPPCSKFYLRQHENVVLPPFHPIPEPEDPTSPEYAEFLRTAVTALSRRDARFEEAAVVSAWEIFDGAVRELDPASPEAVDHGAIRGELFENAIVDFWIEPANGHVHTDWVFGPKYGLGQTSRVQHRNGGVGLEEIAVRWEA